LNIDLYILLKIFDDVELKKMENRKIKGGNQSP